MIKQQWVEGGGGEGGGEGGGRKLADLCHVATVIISNCVGHNLGPPVRKGHSVGTLGAASGSNTLEVEATISNIQEVSVSVE